LVPAPLRFRLSIAVTVRSVLLALYDTTDVCHRGENDLCGLVPFQLVARILVSRRKKFGTAQDASKPRASRAIDALYIPLPPVDGSAMSMACDDTIG